MTYRIDEEAWADSLPIFDTIAQEKDPKGRIFDPKSSLMLARGIYDLQGMFIANWYDDFLDFIEDTVDAHELFIDSVLNEGEPDTTISLEELEVELGDSYSGVVVDTEVQEKNVRITIDTPDGLTALYVPKPPSVPPLPLPGGWGDGA